MQGGISLRTDQEAWSCLTQPVPAAPWTLTAAILPWVRPGYAQTGLVLYDEATGRLLTMVYSHGNGSMIEVAQWNSVTSFQGVLAAITNYAFTAGIAPVWLRIQDDGSQYRFSLSGDGRTWEQIASNSRTAWLSATRIGWGVNRTDQGQIARGTLISWLV